jgi:putative hydrolase of the HAD superfamily
MRNLEGIRGVGFDLDGTLYANYHLHIRLIPFVIREFPLTLAWFKVRNRLHAQAARETPVSGDFYDTQAALVAAALGGESAVMRDKLDRLIYRGWEKAFARIRPFPGLAKTLAAFRAAGLRLGLLSDFPPARKLKLLGLADFFDAAFSTESTGTLKPDSAPFRKLAGDMGLAPEEVLYVGNSPRYDIAGAKKAGMKAALIRRGALSTGFARHGAARADFVFKSYRQLRRFVLD